MRPNNGEEEADAAIGLTPPDPWAAAGESGLQAITPPYDIGLVGQVEFARHHTTHANHRVCCNQSPLNR